MALEPLKGSKDLKAWKCRQCNSMIGILHPGGTMAIKYKTLTCFVQGTIRIICRLCQTENSFQTNVPLQQLLREHDIKD